MADGGVSTYIMLITALLVSSSVSAVLIQEWSSTSRVIQQQQRGIQLAEELSIDFAGDPMNVNIDRSTTPDEITFYVLNTGKHRMDENQMEILIDGQVIPSLGVSTTFVGSPTPSSWDSMVLIEIVLSNNSFDLLNNDADVSIFVTVNSEEVAGVSGSASFNSEVRLNG